MRTILCGLLLLFSLSASAQVPMKSAAWQSPTVACGTGHPSADVMPFDWSGNWNTQNVLPGAGKWPAGQSLSVRRVCVAHLGDFTGGYAVGGHSGPNGDHVTPYVPGMNSRCMYYEHEAPVVVTGGEYFDVHADCSSGMHYVVLTIWYTQP